MAQPLPGGEAKILVRGAYSARVAASGQLLYLTQGTLFAAPFDVSSLTITGRAVPVVEQDPVQYRKRGRPGTSISRSGMLVYPAGAPQTVDRPMSWMDRNGALTPFKSGLAVWGTPRFAPDGRRVAITRAVNGANLDIWTYDLERDTLTRVTTEAGQDAAPVWTPDGRRVAFGWVADAGPFNLFWKRADGTGEAQRLTQSKIAQLPNSWHPTRPILAFHDNVPPNPQRVMLLELEGDDATGWKAKEPVEFIRDAYRNVMPIFSPDGKWLAYLSDKAGQFELYVRPFPGPATRCRYRAAARTTRSGRRDARNCSTPRCGGTNTTGSGRIMVAPYTVQAGAFKPERSRLWSPMARVTLAAGAIRLQLNLIRTVSGSSSPRRLPPRRQYGTPWSWSQLLRRGETGDERTLTHPSRADSGLGLIR